MHVNNTLYGYKYLLMEMRSTGNVAIHYITKAMKDTCNHKYINNYKENFKLSGLHLTHTIIKKNNL